ncbi:hypothetical protein MtrunA17_Chr7g0225541 [Medicago truncatula]|uniref:Late embryogenesis abundant protein LEA-2 subgroup domain-containing protein n=1 Tax=Medicago truncatula TaxID=3880 RepID=A0A396GV79_MEDTR|nr:hypothetical protein MtrunA17_Chr7g0225541 [Medicago truncatula]
MKCIHWLFISIVIYFIFIIGFTLHLPRITLHLPTLPHVIPKFEVSSASLYSLNINSSRISAEWDVTLNVLNPKYWLDVSYKVVSVGVHYNSKHAQDHLGAILLDSFFHGSNDNVTLGVRFNMTVHVDDKVATDIVVSRSRGRVKFGILLSLLVNYSDMFYFYRGRPLKVYCDPLYFVLSPRSPNWVLLHGLTCH